MEHQGGVKQIDALIVKNMQSLTNKKFNMATGTNKMLRRQAFQRWMLKINNKYVKDEKQMLAAYKKIK